jgi:transglutaminase-like putative cysteine protease
MAAALAVAIVRGAAARDYAVGPAGAWVIPMPPAAASSTQHATGGVHYEILERQSNLTLDPPQYYYRTRLRVLNQEGLAEAAQFTLDFDPSDERPTLHYVRIERAGTVIDAFANADRRVLRREQRLEYQIFDGTRTLVVSLKDVRAGDVVDMAYTLAGENPALAGHPSMFVLLSSPRAVGIYRHRVIWPAARPGAMRVYSGAPDPVIERSPAAVEYRWELKDVRPARIFGSLPAGYTFAPKAEITSFRDWNEVAVWGAALYSPSGPVAPSVRAIAREIADHTGDAEQRTLAALALVQDQVRYLGDFLGAGAYQPRPAAEVLSRRYGDCKGKTVLLLELLRALDVPAVPALVSGFAGRELDIWMPDPRLFDHVIVRVTLDGRHHWLDPTMHGQRGATLAHRSAAMGEWALVLARDTRKLELMEMPPEVRSDTRIRKLFRATSYSEPAQLTVTSEYRGWAAVNARLQSLDQNVTATSELYERFYRDSYPEIRRLDSLVVQDVEDSNLVRIVESYEIPNFWKQDSTSGRYTANLAPIELRGYVPHEVEADREAPLGLPGPKRTRCETRLDGPEDWGVEASDRTVANSFLRFRSEERAEAHSLYLAHEIESYSWLVPAELTSAHRDKFKGSDDMFEFIVTSAIGRVGRPILATVNPPILVTLLLTLASCSVLLVWGLGQTAPGWWFARVGPPEPVLSSPSGQVLAAESDVPWTHDPDSLVASARAEPLPFGGWLVLVAFGVVLTPFKIAYDALHGLSFLDRAVWNASLDVAGAARNLMPFVLAFELVSNLVLLTVSIWTLVAFFRRQRIFPFLFILLCVSSIVYRVVDLLLASQVVASDHSTTTADVVGVMRSLIGLAIWGTYVVRSKRVQQTFVR